MIECQMCGHLNLDDDKFCGQCGNILSESVLSEPENYCPNCDIIFDNFNNFCTQCGTKLVGKPEQLKSINKNNINKSSFNQNKNINVNKNSCHAQNKNINSNYAKRNNESNNNENYFENLINSSSAVNKDINFNYTKRNKQSARRKKQPAPNDNFIEKLIATSNVKQKVDTKDTVIIVEEDFEIYSHLNDYQLLDMWEEAIDNRWHIQKSADTSTQAFLNSQISSLERELIRRNIHPYY